MELCASALGFLILQQIVVAQQDYCPLQDNAPESELPYLPSVDGQLPYLPSYLPPPGELLPNLPSCLPSPDDAELPYLPSPPLVTAPTYYPPELPSGPDVTSDCLPTLPPLPDISLGLPAAPEPEYAAGESYEPPPSEYCPPPQKKCCLKEKCGKLFKKKNLCSGLKEKMLAKKIAFLNKMIGKLYKPNKCSLCQKNEECPAEYEGYYPPAPYPAPYPSLYSSTYSSPYPSPYPPPYPPPYY